jgi:altronate dehydratase/ABC-type amino acid transport system permease subunit
MPETTTPDMRPANLLPPSLHGYPRADGRKGIRNVVVVAYLVECAHHVAREITLNFRQQQGDVEVHLVGFPGCYPNEYAERMMTAITTHPNVGAALLISLGCESMNKRKLEQAIEASGRPVHTLTIQQKGGTRSTIREGTEWVEWALAELAQQQRVPMGLDELIVGTICGGSDGTSGITANPAVGRAFDLLIAQDARCIFEETGELIGCEFHMKRRAATPELGEAIVECVNKAARYYSTMGHGSFAPGNADGGLSTIEEKSLGAYAKSGASPINGIVKPGDVPPQGGLYLLDVVPDGEPRFGFPNISDNAEIVELIACGAHLILFTTGRGSVVGSAVSPVIKVDLQVRLHQRAGAMAAVPARRLADHQAVARRDTARPPHRNLVRHRPRQPQPRRGARLCDLRRGDPQHALLVQIFLVYFGLASIGLKVPAFIAAVLALVINVGAYTTEIMRAGIESIHKGQIEAAECLALSRAQIYWHVILRPAMERVYPALTSQFVLLMLATSITSQISAEELTAIANRVQSDTFRSFETYAWWRCSTSLLSLLMRGASGPPARRCSRAAASWARRCERRLQRQPPLVFLLQGAGWTLVLSLIAFVGGGLLGFIVALCRISPVKAAALAVHRLRAAGAGHAAADPDVPGVLRPQHRRPQPAGAGRGRHRLDDDLRQRLYRRDLARLHPGRAAHAVGSRRVPGAVRVPAHGAGDPAAGLRIATPPTVGFMVQIVKNTSLASVVGFVELARAGQVVNNSIFQPFLVYMLSRDSISCCASPSRGGAGNWNAACWWPSRGGRRGMSIIARQRAQELRRAEGARWRELQREQGRGVRHHRPQRLRQEHGAALHRPAGAHRPGPHRGVRPRGERPEARPAPAAPRRGHRLPELQPVPAPHGRREHRAGAAAQQGQDARRGERADRPRAGAGGLVRQGRATRSSSRAASSSAWPSRARSPWSRR